MHRRSPRLELSIPSSHEVCFLTQVYSDVDNPQDIRAPEEAFHQEGISKVTKISVSSYER